MTTRRTFIKKTSLLSAAFLVDPSDLTRGKSVIGLQLYTVRDAMQKDPAGTLAKVAQIGYNSVEGATYTGTETFYGYGPAEFARLLKQNGLIMPSAHYRLGEEKEKNEPVKGTMLNDWNKAVDDAAA